MVGRICLICWFLIISSAAFPSEPAIHSMVVGDRVLELVENRQLTFRGDGEVLTAAISPDGKRLAFIRKNQNDDSLELCLVPTKGGRITAILDARPRPVDATDHTKAGQTCVWRVDGPLAWSRDSKLLAFPATRLSETSEQPAKQCFLLVVESNGAFWTAVPLPEVLLWGNAHGLMFHPDSRQLGAVWWRSDGEPQSTVNLIDIQEKSARTLYADPDRDALLYLVNWADAGESLLCLGVSDDAGLRKIWLNGRSPETLVPMTGNIVTSAFSPDITKRILTSDGALCIENRQSRHRTPLTGVEQYNIRGWSPDSSVVCYTQDQAVKDTVSARNEEVSSLWVASADGQAGSTMLVALGGGVIRGISWSSDCTRIAYISDDRVHIAELNWPDPTPEEKLAAGLPLSEEDEKHLTMDNAKMIARAVLMYAADWEDVYPTDPVTELQPYVEALRADNPFCRPGTDQVIFQFRAGGLRESDIDHAADTIIGELDPGVYSWKIVLYADGHVTQVPK